MSGGARRKQWKALPYEGAFRSVDCAEVFATADCERLRQGLLPEVMEDKWFVFFEDPYLYFHRSWTGELAYRLRLDVDGEGGRIGEALASSHVQLVHGLAYEGALVAFLLRGMMLRQSVSFPVPPAGAPGPKGLFQHSVSGTGFPEQPYGGRRPSRIRAALARVWRRITTRRS
jgi:hypothetical protein